MKKEMRIITERFDEKYANGIKTDSGLSDDNWDGLAHQSDEYSAVWALSKRNVLIDFISKTYKIDLQIDDESISIGDRHIIFNEYYPTKIAGTMSIKDLSDMDSNFFREKIAEVLAAIPGAMAKSRKAAEQTPYTF